MNLNPASRLHAPHIKFFHKIYVCSPMQAMAERLADSDPQRFGDVVCIEQGQFPDGNQSLSIPWPDSDGQNLLYIASYFHNDEQKLTDFRIMKVLSERGARHLTVIVPFFGSATNERVERGVRKGVPYETVAVAALDAKELGTLGNGNTRVRLLLWDLHTLANQFYFPASVSVVMCSTVPYVLQHLAEEIDVVVAPDAGALQRFKQFFGNIPSTYYYKERSGNGDERVMRAAEPEKVKGKRVLIIDDLTRTGGTIAECAQACRANGATAVSAFVAHAVFPKGEERAFLAGGKFAGSVDRFYTTNSLPAVAARLEQPLFQVLDLAEIIALARVL